MHGFDKRHLTTFRDAIVRDESGAAREATLALIATAGGYKIGGQSRKTVPRSYEASHLRARFLLYEGLTGSLEVPIPPEASSARCIDCYLTHSSTSAL